MAELLWIFEVEDANAPAEAIRRMAEAMGDADALRFAEEAAAELAQVADVLKTTLDASAEVALATAAYNHRTGQLDRSTYAGTPTESGGTVSCEFGARAEYASFVEKRGFSRTEEVAAHAEVVIGERLAALGSRFSG